MHIDRPEGFKYITHCRACKGSFLMPWLSLGEQPPANNLLTEPFEYEIKYPLEVVYCANCELFQLSGVIESRLLFDNYLYLSSIGPSFVKHFEDFARDCFKMKILKKGDLVVDIGSNDGILLKPMKKLGAKVIGVEPAKKIAEDANVKGGIPTYPMYFNSDLASEIYINNGGAKMVTATNVFAHVDDLDEILNGVKILLLEGGIFVIEVAYLPQMLKDKTFDLIYHEHLCYYTAYSLEILLKRNGMVIDRYEFIDTHGGSLRVYARKYNQYYDDLSEFKATDQGILGIKEMKDFLGTIEENRAMLCTHLKEIKEVKKRIVGYGAPAKMSTMTNFFDIGPETIDYIVDDAPSKQGKYSPGKHIPITALTEDLLDADYVLIFAWNFEDAIIEKLKAFGYKGKFIIPVPNVRIRE